MSDWTFHLFVGLLVGGAACGYWRECRWSSRRGPPRRGRPLIGVLATIALVVPVASIGLAKLFESAVLGWLFGLTLMLEIALVPCAVVLWVGFLSGAAIARRRRRVSDARCEPPGSSFVVRIDRDSVCAGDDCESHERIVEVPSTTRLAAFVEGLLDDRYLPSIQDGEATWTIESRGRRPTVIAVCAQQWSHPRLIVSDEPLSQHFVDRRPALTFRYHAQASSETVLGARRDGALAGLDTTGAGRTFSTSGRMR